MDIDTLARDVAERLLRGDLSSPPFPPYFARWVEREHARAVDAYGPGADDPPAHVPALEAATEQDSWRLGDLDVHLYRIEPASTALLLVLRAGQLAYVSALAGAYAVAADAVTGKRFPPFGLLSSATAARAEGELELMVRSVFDVPENPVHVSFEIDPGRYARLDDAQRIALHEACTPIARDIALLHSGRSGPLSIVLLAPDPAPQPGARVVEIGRDEIVVASFDVA